MALKDLRAKMALRGGDHQTAGRHTVQYRDASGTTMNAEVVGQGTSSGLRLRIRNRGTGPLVIDNVPKATTMKSTGAYFDRLGLGGN